MNRKWGKAFLPLCMLLLVIAGACMPRAVSFLQDQNSAAHTETRPLSGIQLTLHQDGEVEQTLSLFAADHAKIDLRDGAALTQDQAEAAAREAVDRLVQEKLLPDFTLGTAEAISSYAIISAGGGDSAVIWECTFRKEQQPTCVIRIDDITGQLLSVSYVPSVYATVETSQEDHKILLKRWQQFLQEYYGLDSAAVTESHADHSSDIYTLEFTWTAKETVFTCEALLTFRSQSVFFNW